MPTSCRCSSVVSCLVYYALVPCCAFCAEAEEQKATTLRSPVIAKESVEALLNAAMAARHSGTKQEAEIRAETDIAVAKLRASLGTKPVYVDPAVRLRQEEFETSNAFRQRIAEAQTLERKRHSEAEKQWDEQKVKVDKAVSQAVQERDDAIAKAKRSFSSALGARGGKTDPLVVAWREHSSLSRFDADRGVFPAISCVADRLPTGEVVLYRGPVGKFRDLMVLGHLDLGGTFAMKPTTIKVAREFKQGWTDGKLTPLALVEITDLKFQDKKSIVMRKAIYGTEAVRTKGPNYTKAAGTAILGGIMVALGAADPSTQQMISDEFGRSLGESELHSVLRVPEEAIVVESIVFCGRVVGLSAAITNSGNLVPHKDIVSKKE